MDQKKVVCSNCILHSQIPGVEIKEDGICNACYDHAKNDRFTEKAVRYARKRMELILRDIHSIKRMYDALVLFSGGKDSTYLLKMVKDYYNLRPLAFTVMHPLVNETASANAEKVAKGLGVDLIKIFPEESVFKKVIKYGILNPDKFDLDEFFGCSICSYFFYWLSIKYAIKMDIPVIFTGDDVVQSKGLPRLIYGESVKQQLRRGIKPYGKLHDLFMDALGPDYEGSIYDCNIEELLESNYPSLVSPFTFIEHNYKDNFEQIEKLGLDSKKFNKLLTNCNAIPFFAYFTLKRFDCVPYIKDFAAEIRTRKPYFTQYLMNTEQQQKLFNRDAFLLLLKEYKDIVFYIVDKGLNRETLTEQERSRILSMAPTFMDLFGKDISEGLMNKALAIDDYVKYFDIPLKDTVCTTS